MACCAGPRACGAVSGIHTAAGARTHPHNKNRTPLVLVRGRSERTDTVVTGFACHAFANAYRYLQFAGHITHGLGALGINRRWRPLRCVRARVVRARVVRARVVRTCRAGACRHTCGRVSCARVTVTVCCGAGILGVLRRVPECPARAHVLRVVCAAAALPYGAPPRSAAGAVASSVTAEQALTVLCGGEGAGRAAWSVRTWRRRGAQVIEGLKRMYFSKVRPLEEKYRCARPRAVRRCVARDA